MTTGLVYNSVIQSPHYRPSGSGRSAMPEWASLSIKEAAERTGYHVEYLRRLIRDGKLEAVRVGRVFLIRVSSLEAYVASLDPEDARTGARRK